MTENGSDLLAKFEAFELSPKEFGHRQHTEVAYEMIRKYGFLKTMSKYPADIKRFATNAGAPKKFHVTMTLALLSLIAERMNGSEATDFDAFITANADLLERDVLSSWYTEARLNSDAARTQFLLPDRSADH